MSKRRVEIAPPHLDVPTHSDREPHNMAFWHVLKVTNRSIGAGLAASAVIWLASDIYGDRPITSSWSGFLLMVLIVSMAFSPVFFLLRKRQARCPNCGAAWKRSEIGRELIRAYPLKKGSDVEVEEYWQHWECQACHHRTREKQYDHNTDKVAF